MKRAEELQHKVAQNTPVERIIVVNLMLNFYAIKKRKKAFER